LSNHVPQSRPLTLRNAPNHQPNFMRFAWKRKLFGNYVCCAAICGQTDLAERAHNKIAAKTDASPPAAGNCSGGAVRCNHSGGLILEET
jgi:hypothetical protein